MSGRVLVIGAGVGGLALGRSLARLGIQVQIFEAHSASVTRLNRGLGLWEQSQSCLRNMGLSEWLDKNAHFIPPAAYRSTDGAWLSRASAAPHNRRRVACVEQNALLAALGAGLDIARGKRLTAVREHADGVEAIFEDGTSSDGVALIGADGVRSAVRAALFPDAALHHAGEVCISGFLGGVDDDTDAASAAAGPLPFETIGTTASGPARLAVVPIGPDRHFWFATLPARPALAGAGAAAAASEPAPGWESRLAGWHDPIPAILAAARRPAPAPPPLREDVVSLARPLGRWSRGRCGLLGDACHVIAPNLAQGAAVAIEDAAELAPRLAAAAASPRTNGGGGGGGAAVAAALSEYEARRRPRAEACRRVTGFTRWLCARPGLARLMRHVPPAVNGRVFDAFLDHSLAATAASRAAR